MRHIFISIILAVTFLTPLGISFAATLDVGDEKPFQRLEDAVARAKPS